MTLACDENLKYSIPGLFSKEGYRTLGFHNNSYTYYSRNITHPKLGMSWYGVGGCEAKENDPNLDIGEKMSPGWPRSDKELIMSTSDIYFDSNDPFFVYYLTVSGHNNYSFSENIQSQNNRDAVKKAAESEQAKAYLAAQIELEKALSELIQKLEEIGKLNDTVIALSNDHYPYGLSPTWQGNGGKDILSELAEKQLDRYEKERGVCFIWNSEMKEKIKIEKPTSGFDLMPTLLNLFGIKYDSRLLFGHDALSDSEGFVPFSDGSFISDCVSYFANEDKYVRNVIECHEEPDEVSQRVRAKIKYSRKVRQTDFFKHIG